MLQCIIKSHRTAFFIAAVCVIVSACASDPDRTTTRCAPLLLSPQAISQAVDAGEVFRAQTKEFLYTLVNVKLDEGQVLVGTDRAVDKEVRLPLNKIKSICTLPGDTYEKRRSANIVTTDDLSYSPLLIMLPAAPLAPFFQSLGSQGMTKEEVRREIGEPIKRYTCGFDDLEVWEYEKGKLFPKWTSIKDHTFITFRWWDDLFWPGTGSYSDEGLDILRPCKPYTETK